jgi:LPS export ABC transporter protein LptC
MSNKTRYSAFSFQKKPVFWAIALFTVSSFITASCEKKLETVKKSDIESLPSVTVRDFRTIYSDSSLKQLEMTSPIVERYTARKPPYSEFRQGIKVLFFDGNKESVGSLASKYARVMEERRVWELRDSVVGINEKNEKLETELLYWDQPKDIIYTDRFVRMTSEEQIVMGTGLEADSRFTNWKIRNISFIYYLKDEK